MISATLLSSYDYCARKLFLEQVLKLFVMPKEALLKGIIRHEIFENLARHEEKIVAGINAQLTFPQVFGIYKNTCSSTVMNVLISHKPELREIELDLPSYFEALLPISLSYFEKRALNTYSFLARKKLYGEELWKSIFPKILPEQSCMSEVLKLKGKLDQIEQYPDRIMPVEFKTGSCPDRGVWPGHQLQMGAYLMLLKEKNPGISEGIIRYLDSNQDRPVLLNPFLEEKIIRIRDDILAMLESKQLPGFAANKNKCKSCSLRDKCYDEKFIKARLKELT